MKKLLALLLLSLSLLAFVACSDDDDDDTSDADATQAASGTVAAEDEGPVTLRLGYFPNITHSQPLVGLSRGTYEELLGENVTLETTTFNAGPAVIEALFAGAIDASYIGPQPGYQRLRPVRRRRAPYRRWSHERRRVADSSP